MRTGLKIAIATGVVLLLTLAAVGGPLALIWLDLDRNEQDAFTAAMVPRVGLVLIFALVLFVALAIVVRRLARLYVEPPTAMANSIKMIMAANPGHRVAVAGAAEVRELARTVNTLADAHQQLAREVNTKVTTANAALEEEKNRLAALMSELTQSVLVCNIEGRILLYNARAKQLLGATAEKAAVSSGLVGLGRSLYAVMDREVILHALDSIQYRLERDAQGAVSSFVASTKGGLLVRGTMAPVLDQSHAMTGYVLTLDDVTQSIEVNSRRDVLVQSLTEATRGALANIRAAVETMVAFPNMNPGRSAQFIRVIQEESRSLSVRLDNTMQEYSDYLKSNSPIEDVRGIDLVAAACRRIEEKVHIPAKMEMVDGALWLKCDSYSLTRTISYLASRLKDEFAIREVRLGLEAAGRRAHLDLVWSGAPLTMETVMDWEREPMNLGGEASPMTLKEVVDRHDGEVWYELNKASQRAFYRILLPVTRPRGDADVKAVESRPEFYDFDLFHQPGQNPELDQRGLAELSYTVFDTETTGLQPTRGDEIISIGAVRIVNGRMLAQEKFDELVDPRRELPDASVAVHGITAEMLASRPPIEAVLPAFHSFAEDTVLVGHNVAFDMKFLQMKEARVGVSFAQPVLDTLLLAEVIYPEHDAYALEAIAERFGVEIRDRHTALGDALATAEVFLKMIPLLAAKGIRTLREARETSQRTYFARIKY